MDENENNRVVTLWILIASHEQKQFFQEKLKNQKSISRLKWNELTEFFFDERIKIEFIFMTFKEIVEVSSLVLSTVTACIVFTFL